MAQGIILGLVFVGLLVLLARHLYRQSRSPKAILKEEMETERRRRARIQESMESVRALSRERLDALAKGIRDMADGLEDGQEARFQASDQELVLEVSGTAFRITHVFKDITDWKPENGRFVVESQDGPAVELADEQECLRYLAREIAKLSG